MCPLHAHSVQWLRLAVIGLGELPDLLQCTHPDPFFPYMSDILQSRGVDPGVQATLLTLAPLHRNPESAKEFINLSDQEKEKLGAVLPVGLKALLGRPWDQDSDGYDLEGLPTLRKSTADA